MDGKYIISVPLDSEVLSEYPKSSSTHFRSRSHIDMIFETVRMDRMEDNLVVSMLNPKFNVSQALSLDSPMHPGNRNELHSHDYYELMFVIDGEIYQNIEYKRHLYPKGSLCLLNRNIHHAEEFSTDYRVVFLMIAEDLANSLFFPTDSNYFREEDVLLNSQLFSFFNRNSTEYSSTVREYIDFIPAYENETEYRKMYKLFDRLTSHFLNPSLGSTYEIKAILMQIFKELINEEYYNTVPVDIGSDKEMKIFDDISHIMKKNNGRVSRSILEKELSYSGSYLNGICKKYSGLNLFNYGMTICMKKACKLLSETTMSISDIAEELQFTNRTHFYKLFEESFGMPPAKYRSEKLGK